MIKEYISYLKDNPEGYWFKRKLYGWGWTPARWQGFLVLFLYVVAVVYLFLKIDAESHSVSDTLIGIAVPFFLLTALLLSVNFVKGERPRWQWGVRNEDESVS